ncbi:MAG: hypothetical protein K2L02_00045 [Clostridia bacterium]|nr:hypothetical protein [Clostridia bacterium]
MISYDQYENRIKKLAKFRNFMNRFKFLFIAIFALIIAALATLLALKGSLSGEIKITSSVYGDGYSDPEGVSAFWSSVSYEYAREGSDDWSGQKPVKAGKYSVRAVSNKTVGKGYGKETKFEIAPREVTFDILSDSVEYGGVPKDISCALLTGDVLDKNALLFVYDDYVATNTGVDLDESSVKIMNGTDDRSSCYTVKHEKKELDITKRKIDVSLKRYNFTYSGSAVSYSATASDQTEGRLADGDIIRFGAVQLSKDGVEIENAVYADSYEAVAQEFHIYKVIGEKEIEVTEQYDASSFAVSFEIEKKLITVTTANSEKVYDGTPLKKEDSYTVTGLVKGDSFSAIEDSGSEITNAGSTRNEIDYTIKNGDNNVKDNYSVDWKYGTLTVKQREITVTSLDMKEVYDGTRHGRSEVAMQDDLFVVKASGTPRTTIKTVGTLENVVNYEIYKKSDENFDNPENKDNFKINEKWGTLEITPRSVTITIQNVSKVYDGEPLYATLDDVVADNLAGSDKLSDDDTGWKSITDVAENVPNNSEYKIVCGNEDRTQNYKITYSNPKGTLTVTPRHIVIETQTNTFVYNSQPQSDDRCTVYDYESGAQISIKDGSLKSDKVAKFTDVWDTAEENNDCTYTVSKNYVIESIIRGTITITARPIIVVTADATKVYDGDALSKHAYVDTYYIDGASERQTGIFDDDKHDKLSKTGIPRSITSVSESGDDGVDNVCKFSVPNQNYTIGGYDYGTLKITPRPIRVVTDDAEKIYDNKPLSKHVYVETYYIDESGKKQKGLLQEGETLAPDVPCSITNVSETKAGNNQCTFTVPNKNYTIAGYDCGTLTITARPIIVVTASDNKIYDGNPLSNYAYVDTYYIDEKGERQTGIFDDDAHDKLQRKGIYRSITNVSESGDNGVDNVCEFAVHSDNYTIQDYVYGKLKITRRPVLIQVSDVEAVYGYDYEVYKTGEKNFKNAATCGLVNKDTVEIEVKFDLSEFMSTFTSDELNLIAKGILPVRWDNDEVVGYEGAVKYKSKKFHGVDVNNYEFDYKDGTLTITRRVLLVAMADATTYYGEDLLPQEEGDKTVYLAGDINGAQAVYEHDKGSEGLLEGDKLTIIKVRYFDKMITDPETNSQTEHFVSPKNAGTYQIKPYEIWIDPAFGEIEKTKDEEDDEYNGHGNYLIRFYSSGTLTIKKRPIELTLAQIGSTRYDGKVREYETGEEVITLALGTLSAADKLLLKNPAGLVYGEELNVAVKFSKPNPKDADYYTYTFDEGNSFITVDEAPVDGGLDNYVITCEGTYSFQIFHREITIKMKNLVGDQAHTYGESYPFDVDAIDNLESIDFADGESVVSITVTYVNCDGSVGKYVIKGSNAQIFNYAENGTDGFENVTKNYLITYQDGSLEILKKDVSVTVNKQAVKYGENILPNEYTISSLAYNESIILTFEYPMLPAGKGVGKYDVTITPVLSKGKSLDNYNITYYDEEENVLDITELSSGLKVATLEEGLVIEKLPIFVSVDAQEVVYGAAIKKASFTISYELSNGTVSHVLPYNEKLSVEIFTKNGGEIVTPKYADTYSFEIGKVSVVGKEDGLNNYDVTLADEDTNGKLIITPRPITLELQPLTITYGEAVEYDEDFVICKLAAGSTLGYEDTYSVTPVFDLGDTNANRPDADTYEIYDDVDQRVIKDGEGNLTCGKYTIADSYDITVINSKLTVMQREVTLTLEQLPDCPYDGQTHNYDINRFTIGETDMAEGETLVIAVKYLYAKNQGAKKDDTEDIAKAGYYAYAFDLEESYVEHGGKKGIKNYTFTAESYTEYYCEISRLNVKIKINDMEGVTFGEVVSYPGGAKKYDNLIEGETLEISVSFRNERGAVYENEGLVLPAGEYAIIPSADNNPKIYSSNSPNFADIDNYVIEYENGAFTVDKRAITITLSNLNVDYGETPVYPDDAGNYDDIEGHLGDEKIIVHVNINLPPKADVQTYVGAVTYENAVIVLNGEIVTESYTVSCAPSDVTVNKRKIIVTTPSREFVYDGEEHTATDYTIVYAKDSTKGLAEGDTSEIIGKIPVVTDYFPTKTKNEYAIVVTSGEVDISEKNYIIEYDDETPGDDEYYGYISITRRVLYVETESVTKVYDGEALTSPDTVDSIINYTIIDEQKDVGLVKGHKFKIEPITIVDAQEKINDIVVDILDGSDESKKNNYDIQTSELGKLTIEKRVIYVEAPSDEKVYDGTPLYSPKDKKYMLYFYPDNKLDNAPISVEWSKEGDDTSGILVSGHKFNVETPSITNAGIKINNPFLGVLEGEVNQSKNYSFVFEEKEIDLEYGILKVKKRSVSYRFDADYVMDYCNAAPPTDELRYTIQEEDGDEGVLNEERDTFDYRIKYAYDVEGQEITRFNAGTYKMLLELGNLSKRNYEFKLIKDKEGTLTINQVELKMIPASKSAYYGDCQEIKLVLEDDLECIGLVDGDTLEDAGFNRYSLKASENKPTASVKITKSKVVIVDEEGNNITKNYIISTQMSTLTFTRRTLYVQQIVPDYIADNGGSIAYTGKTHTIENNGELFHVIGASDLSKKWVVVNSHTVLNLENYDGLYSSDKVQFKSASVPKNVATYYNWLKVNVVNSSGSIVTKLYDIIFVDEVNTQSSIEVLPEKVSVTFNSELTMELLNSETYKDGVTLIDSDYFEVSSDSDFFEDDYEVEAAVYKKDGVVEAIYIFIYVTKYDQYGNFKSRADKSIIFEIEETFESGIDIPVKIRDIGYYPAPSNQGVESEL